MIGFGAVITLMFKANETSYQFNIIDKSGIFTGQMKPQKDITYIFAPVSTENALKTILKEEKSMDGILIIPELKDKNYDELEKNTKLLVNKKISFDTKIKLGNALSDVIKKEKIKNLGLKENQIVELDKNFNLNTENIADKTDKDNDFAFGVKSALSGILMYAVFMFIIIYGVRVMRSVLEEKNNRVVEIIISSVKPFELMMGKILGVTGVALTQFLIWITMSVIAALVFNRNFTPNPAMIGSENPMDKLGNFTQMFTTISHTLLDMNYVLIIFVFIFYFILGYLFYSSIYAAVGSAVDNETETQQFTMFAILPLMLGMYGSFSIMNNPEGPIGFWLSMIPLTSPVAMIARIPFGVPVWQLVLSMVLLILSTLFMIYVAAKIYRVGILMYGNKATLKELWKWITSA